MQELINDLLAFSRVSTKAKASVMTDLDQLLSKVLTDLRLAHAEDHAEITHDKLPSLCVDPTQMSLLFQNLVANSIKFRGKHAPVIHISAKRDGDFWHFCVQDNGIGIAPQYFDKIFVVFKRLHNHEEYPGTGIGLASCKKIVERHGGQIWVESSIGAGSKFHFTISTSTAN
jgi:light-regulated signal transduction histidine kinase (bacteriophytochrome)